MNISDVYDDKSKGQAGVEDDEDVNEEFIETSDDPTNDQDGEYENLEGKLYTFAVMFSTITKVWFYELKH